MTADLRRLNAETVASVPDPLGPRDDTGRWTNEPADLRREEIARIAERHVEFRCSCGDRRWVDDENWQPPYPAEPWTRSQGDGLIPCGSCNHGGWEVSLFEPADPPCAEDGQPWPCDAAILLRSQDTATARIAALRDAAWDQMRQAHERHDMGHRLGAWPHACACCEAAIAARAVLSGETRTGGEPGPWKCETCGALGSHTVIGHESIPDHTFRPPTTPAAAEETEPNE